jgi:hypothetical protein
MTTDDDPGLYFYYNTIDCNYAYACGNPPPAYNPDALFSYNASDNKFRYKILGDGEPLPTHVITNGEIINAWDILNEGTTPKTTGFEDYWDHALMITNNGNNKPRIVWGPYPDPNSLPGTITGYKVYRSAHHPPGQPGSFSYLATVGSGVFHYTDGSATIGTDYDANSYYVKTVYQDEWEVSGESGPTNTVEVRLEIPQKRATGNKILSASFNLGQNYPNPFNPETKINYTLPEDAKVNIKVYDMLGTEVAELVNETKPAGYFEVTFDASALSSGVYVYRITALKGDRILFNVSKTMILMK